MLDEQNFQSLATSYLRYCDRGKDEDYWAWEEIYQAIREEPQKALAVILLSISNARSKEQLQDIGAGLLESLMKENGPQVIDAIEDEFATNKRLRYAFSFIWLSEKHAAYHKVSELVDAFDIRNRDPLGDDMSMY